LNAGDVAGAERICNHLLATDPANADALHMLGMINLMSGRPAAALEYIARAVAIRPRDAVMQENFGLANLANGRFADAEAAFRRAIANGGRNALVHMRLGMAVSAQGRLDEAIMHLREAAGLSPDNPDVQINLANALAESGQLGEAVTHYLGVLKRYPNHLDTLFNLGTIYRRLKRDGDAERCFTEVLAKAPDYADAHVSLGLLYADRGDENAAIAAYRRALKSAPSHLAALNNLGSALMRMDQEAEADALLLRALALAPTDADTLINLGNLRSQQGRVADAQSFYEQAARNERGAVDAWRNLGKLHRSQGRNGDALDALRMALARVPQNAGTMADIAATYLDAGDLAQAEEWYQKAIAVEPGNATTFRLLGDVLKLAGRYEASANTYEQALALQPDCHAALGGLIHVRQHMAAWDGIEALWVRAKRDAIGKPGSGITPFSILSQPTTPAEQLACARAWTQSEVAPYARAQGPQGFEFSGRHARPEKLRIGYLSWDFHQHATSYLIAELFELHDRERFEVFAYSFGPDDGSAMRARLRNAATGFFDIARHSNVAAARAIHENRIDILVDLKGYTQGARPQIMALRPAPVQINWLGYPGTMGMAQIDAIIADSFIIPEGAEAGFSERIVRLPDCYQINDRHRRIAPPPVRSECGLPAEAFVFCCFNQSYKILPDVFAAWLRILNAIPGSCLWLLETNAWAVRNLRNVAAAQGIAGDRLVFAPVRPLDQHLARYCVADLALDTFPYTSHTTGSDALWAGCPLVTCAGETFASRVAGSLLRAAGVPELATRSLNEMECLAIELAQTPARLADIRSRLAANRDSCALFDSPRFVRALEGAYDSLWSDLVVSS
jgi:predicted O-linked N-acetylglucosamine transferase (SPINDLY family)